MARCFGLVGSLMYPLECRTTSLAFESSGLSLWDALKSVHDTGAVSRRGHRAGARHHRTCYLPRLPLPRPRQPLACLPPHWPSLPLALRCRPRPPAATPKPAVHACARTPLRQARPLGHHCRHCGPAVLVSTLLPLRRVAARVKSCHALRQAWPLCPRRCVRLPPYRRVLACAVP